MCLCCPFCPWGDFISNLFLKTLIHEDLSVGHMKNMAPKCWPCRRCFSSSCFTLSCGHIYQYFPLWFLKLGTSKKKKKRPFQWGSILGHSQPGFHFLIFWWFWMYLVLKTWGSNCPLSAPAEPFLPNIFLKNKTDLSLAPKSTILSTQPCTTHTWIQQQGFSLQFNSWQAWSSDMALFENFLNYLLLFPFLVRNPWVL